MKLIVVLMIVTLMVNTVYTKSTHKIRRNDNNEQNLQEQIQNDQNKPTRSIRKNKNPKVHYFSALSGSLGNRNDQQHVDTSQQQQQLPEQRSTSPSPRHLYWFNKHHPTPFFFLSNQRQWNYCDYKCLYLEQYNPNKDFVVVVLGGLMKQDFSVCYVKSEQEFTLWKQVTSNKFYEENCGQDYKDWIKEKGFDVKGVYGEGIGGKLDEGKMYQ